MSTLKKFKKFFRDNIFFRVPIEDKQYVKKSVMDTDFNSFKNVLFIVFILQIIMLLYRTISNKFVLDTRDILYVICYGTLALFCLVQFTIANYLRNKNRVNQYHVSVAIAVNVFFIWALAISILDCARGTELTTYAYTTISLVALIILEPWVFIVNSIGYSSLLCVACAVMPKIKFYPSVVISSISIALLISIISIVTFSRRIKSIRLQMTVLELNKQLNDYSYMDPLTNLHNRRYLTEHIDEALKIGSNPTGVIMVDIDNFKQINDQYGHQNGDLCLIELGKTINEILTELNDCFAVRYGGEEFLIYIKHIAKKDLASFCEKLRVKIENMQIKFVDGSIYSLTVSIGASSAKTGINLSGLIDIADKNLYFSKNNGKNMVHIE